ncbi:MAG: extracellular solute-binding protein [Anaerolineaceae bacterium]|nr:extracellular solute-binding protein [Anaerolineaceae bacterium]
MSGKISRRVFLKGASLGSAAVFAVVTGCTPQAPKAGEEAAKPNAPAAEPVELRFIKLSMIDEVTEYFEKTAIAKFQEANPGVTVKVDMSDWGHLGEKLLTSFAGNIPVDLVETGSDWVGPYAKRKQFLPIDDYTKLYSEMDDYYTEMVDISRFEGKLVAMPYILDVRTVCYRKDHFKEAGLDPEKPMDTWDDAVSFGKKLVQYDDQGNISRAGFTVNATDPASAFFEFWYYLVENGSGVVVPWESWDPKSVAFNGPEGVEALQFIFDLINTHKISPITGMSAKTPDLSALAEGVTSASVVNAAEVGNWKRNQPDKIDLLGVGVPLMKKKRLQYACPNVYAIGTNTKVPEKAFELMKFMLSKEIMTGMLAPDNALAPRKSVAADADYMKDPLLKKFQEVVEKGWGATTPQACDFPTLEIVGNYVQAALRNEMPIPEALNTAAEEVKKKMEELV